MSNIQNGVRKNCRFCDQRTSLASSVCYNCNYYISDPYNESYSVMFNIIDNGELIFEEVLDEVYEPKLFSHTLVFLFEPMNTIIRIDKHILSPKDMYGVDYKAIIKVAAPQNITANQLKIFANKLIKNLHLI